MNHSTFTEIALRVFNETTGYTNFFVVALFLCRVAYANVTGSSSNEYTDAFKGLVTYYILIMGFPYILDIILALPEQFLPGFNAEAAMKVENVEAQSKESSMIPDMVRSVMEAITAFIYWAAMGIHLIFTIVMCAIAPIIILFACMLGLGIGVKIFFGLFILASCWPIVWAAFDEFNKWIIKINGNDFASLSFELLVQILKSIAPLWMSSMAVKSGPGKALTGSAAAAFGAGGTMGSAIRNGFGSGGEDSASTGGSGSGGGLSAALGSSPSSGGAGGSSGRIISPGVNNMTDPNSRFRMSPTGSAGASDSGPRAFMQNDVPSSSPVRFPTSQQTSDSTGAQGSASGASNQPSAQESHAAQTTAAQRLNGNENATPPPNLSNAERINGNESESNSPTGPMTASQMVNRGPESAEINGTNDQPSGSSSPSSESAQTAPSVSPANRESQGSSGESQVAAAAQAPTSARSESSGATRAGNSSAAPQAGPRPVSKPSKPPPRNQSDEQSDIQALARSQMMADQSGRRKRG